MSDFTNTTVPPHAEVAGILHCVRASDALRSVRLAFEFQVLTAMRSTTVFHARWDEMDLKGAVWTVPAERQRSHCEYRVPVSPQALALLSEIRQHGHADDPEDQSCE